MVVDDFNFIRIAFFPGEADAPLLIDADAMLSSSVSRESFEVIVGRNS